VRTLATRLRPLTVAILLGTTAVVFWLVFENYESPLFVFYAKHLEYFWIRANFLPLDASHFVEIVFTGNPHTRNEVVYVAALFAQWFLLGYLVWWVLTLTLRIVPRQAPDT
jgi:hypothetical protein